MKYNRFLLTPFLSLLLMVYLVGCGKNKSGTASVQPPDTTPIAPGPQCDMWGTKVTGELATKCCDPKNTVVTCKDAPTPIPAILPAPVLLKPAQTCSPPTIEGCPKPPADATHTIPGVFQDQVTTAITGLNNANSLQSSSAPVVPGTPSTGETPLAPSGPVIGADGVNTNLNNTGNPLLEGNTNTNTTNSNSNSNSLQNVISTLSNSTTPTSTTTNVSNVVGGTTELTPVPATPNTSLDQVLQQLIQLENAGAGGNP